MATEAANNLTISGKDWSNRPRELDLDLHLWQKICHWHGDEQKALNWVQLQIKLFSNRHPERNSLSHIVSSIAFVEMANPDHRPQAHVRHRRTQLQDSGDQVQLRAGGEA